MTEDPAGPAAEGGGIQHVGGSRVLQGCLFGAVLLFVALLAVMIVLAYLRFREATAAGEAPLSLGPFQLHLAAAALVAASGRGASR